MVTAVKKIYQKISTSRRVLWLKLTGHRIQVGKGFQCQANFYLARKHSLKVGNNVFFGRYAHIVCDVEIGSEIMIASFVGFVGGDHKFDNIGDTFMRDAGREHNKKVVIKDNVWIGHRATIMAGVTIHSGAVIAAGAVVTADVGPDEIHGGIPAKLIRKRKA